MSDNYVKNMDAIKKMHPEFAKLIEDTPPVDWVLETPKDINGVPNVRIQDSRHKEVLVYKEPISDDFPEQVVLENQKSTLLFGIGSGISLYQLLKRREPKHIVLIVEPVMHMWKIAFTNYDFSEALQDGTIYPCPGAAEVEYCLAWIEGRKAIDGWNKIIDRIAYKRAEYWQLMDTAMNMLNQSLGNINTVDTHGEEMAMNDIGTLPWTIRHRGVKELLGLYANKPAIVIATGPSLQKNIHLLQEVYKNKSAIIIAVAQALRPLLSYGVRPDFICTVDFGEVNMSHLDGLMDEDIPLVTISKAYKPLLSAYKGPKFISATPLEGMSEDNISSIMNHRGALMQGGSVLHMAVGLATCLGCNPITLIGVDLSYPSGDVSHFEQADSMGKIEVVNEMLVWKVKDPRSTLAGTTTIMGVAVYVEGYFGEDVVTNAGLHSFITTLEAYVAQAVSAGVKIIDATEGGAYIKGTRRIFLQDVIDEYCKDSIDKSILIPLLSFADDADELMDKAIPMLEKDIKTLRSILSHVEQAKKYTKKIDKHWEEDILIHCFKKNTYHTSEAHKQALTILTLGYALMKSLRKLETKEYAMDRVSELEAVNNSDIRDKAVKRTLFILNATQIASENLLQSYLTTYNLFITHQEKIPFGNTVLDPTGETKPASLEDTEEYFEEGNFARPMLEADRILKINPNNKEALEVHWKATKMVGKKINEAIDRQKKVYAAGLNKVPLYLDLIQDSKDLGRLGHNEESLNRVKEAVELIPDKTEARWGLATLLHKNGEHEESLSHYVWLREQEPDNLRFDFEMGQVMLKIKERRAEGITLIKSVIKKDPATYEQYKKEIEEIR